MKKLLLASVASGALVFIGGSALAADLPVKYKPPHDDCCNWRGIYIGVHGGYAIPELQGVWDAAGSVHQWSRNDVRGGFWGAQIGFNAQHGKVVWGLEADYSSMRRSSGVIDFEADLQTAQMRGFGTVRARAGVAVDNWLFYATAGYAWANLRAITETGANPALSLNASGIAAGLGVEFCIWNNFSIRAEYLHLAFGQSVDFPITFVDQDVGDHFKLQSINLVRLALNYRFNLGKW